MTESVIIAIIGAIVSLASLAMTLLIKVKQTEIHKQINGKMEQLIETTKQAALAEGKLEGKAESRIESKEDQIP